MNVWKPIAICLATALVASVGVQTASADRNPSPMPGNIAGCGPRQPNMAAAQSALQTAISYLNKAEHNKGGWRVAAVNAATTALNQTATGCNYAE